jgi:hypothetical protein
VARIAAAAAQAFSLARGTEVGHVRGHDGQDTVVQEGALEGGGREGVLAQGGGLLLSSAEGFSTDLNAFTGWLAVASGSRATAVVLRGSEPTRVLGPQVVRTIVLPLTGDVVVHPDGDGPSDLPAGSAVLVQGYPRVLADPDATTALVIESAFDPMQRGAMLLDRAAGHPFLRVDAPAPGVGPVEVYGRDEPVEYADLVRSEHDLLLANTAPELMHWWWVLGRRLPPFPPPARAPELRVRGRFPGGVGEVPAGGELPDEVELFKGAGALLAVPATRRELFTDLVAGSDLVVAHDDPALRSVLNLLAAGAIEVVG